MKQFLDFLDNKYEVILLEEERIKNRTLDLIKTSEEFLEASWSNAALGDSVAAPLRAELQRANYLSLEDIKAKADEKDIEWRSINLFGDIDDPKIEQFRELTAYRGDFEKLMRDIKTWLAAKELVILCTLMG